jgi:hypothetical protein
VLRNLVSSGGALLSVLRPTSRHDRAVLLAVATLLGLAAIAVESLGAIAETPPTPPGAGVLLSPDGELRVNGEIAPIRTPIENGGRLDVLRGDALVQFGETPLALLREGTSVTFDDFGAETTLHHGRAQFEVANTDAGPRSLRVRAGHVAIHAEATSFAVERTRTDDRVRVTVQEGHARVVATNGQRSLRTGDETTVVRGRVGAVRSISHRSSRGGDVAEAPHVERLKQRAARLFHDWSP